MKSDPRDGEFSSLGQGSLGYPHPALQARRAGAGEAGRIIEHEKGLVSPPLHFYTKYVEYRSIKEAKIGLHNPHNVIIQQDI